MGLLSRYSPSIVFLTAVDQRKGAATWVAARMILGQDTGGIESRELVREGRSWSCEGDGERSE